MLYPLEHYIASKNYHYTIYIAMYMKKKIACIMLNEKARQKCVHRLRL